VGAVFFTLLALNAIGGGMIAAPMSGNFEIGAFLLAVSAGLAGLTAAWLLYEKARAAPKA
jgi:hypothetical protein